MIFLIFVIFLCCGCVSAMNVGTYKTETEYGLIDGFKWNFFNRKEGAPLVQLRSETQEEKDRLEREKNKPKEVQDDVQMYRFMLDNTVAF